MNSAEGYLYDARVRLSPSPAASGRIVTVAIDSQTLSTLQGQPDTIDFHKLITHLQKENPEAVMLMVDPSRWTGTVEQKTAFARDASTIFNLFFVTEQLAPASQATRLRLAKPLDNLSLASGPITRDNVSFAADRVTRRILLDYDGQLLLQPVLANLSNHLVRAKDYRGAFESEGSVYSYIRFRPKGSYKRISFADLIQDNIAPGTLRDKIVIIGRDTELDNEDYVLTPYSRSPTAMSKLEAQANVVDTLIQNNGIVKAPAWLDVLFTLIAAYLTVLVVWSARPLAGILNLIGLGLMFLLGGYLSFAAGGFWITLVHPLMAIFISYYFFIPYRLIIENKKSWEYFQKNKLLTQVEELKSNFLSMMSHDLKTPIARIQGLAEIALTEKEKLSINK
jgi:CHASE2 domain-containing sensor protein